MKKKIILIMAVIMLASTAYAVEKSEFAKQMSSMAQSIMEFRQRGVSITESMEIVDKIENEVLQEILKKYVVEAYKTPMFSTERHKKEAITEFGNKIYLRVLETVHD